MDIVLLAGRLLLGGIFSVAGLAKLIDHTGSRQALVGFGVPERWARRFGLLLPIAELSIAISLIPVTTARLGMLGALILLIAFIAGIAGNLARGKHPDCHCFGQLHSAPAGWPALGRNALLLTIAAILLWQDWNDPGVSAVGWLGASPLGCESPLWQPLPVWLSSSSKDGCCSISFANMEDFSYGLTRWSPASALTAARPLLTY